MRAFCPLFNPRIFPRLARPRATTTSLGLTNTLRYGPPQRSIFSQSRLPLKIESRRRQGKAEEIRGVRFVKPKLRFRTIALYIIAYYLCYEAYNRLVLGPLDRAAGEAMQEMEEEDEEEEKPFFIPLPGTTKQLKPVPYKGTDPEWKEFIKFSKDQNLAKKVRDELAGFVQQQASKHPLLKIRCGPGFKLRRYWLDVDFPQHGPPEFERLGIEISDEHIAIAKQPVDSLTVFRIRQVLWPKALVQSMWSFLKVMVTDDAKHIAEKFGFKSSKPPPSIEQIVAKHQQMFKNPQLPNKEGPPASQPPVLGNGSQTITNPPGRDKSPVTGQTPEEVDVGSAGMALHAHFFRPIMAFKAKLAQTWRPAPDFPPRGSILVSGLVELDTAKAWLVFDVKAAWDPHTREYDPRSMHIKLRRMQLKKQGPVGR